MTYVVTTPSFNGPIQTLLQLINGHEMDVLDLPLTPVIEGFVAILRDDSRTIDVEELSEFLLIAAILLEIKSTALLPSAKNAEEDEEFIGWEERDVFLARLWSSELMPEQPMPLWVFSTERRGRSRD